MGMELYMYWAGISHLSHMTAEVCNIGIFDPKYVQLLVTTDMTIKVIKSIRNETNSYLNPSHQSSAAEQSLNRQMSGIMFHLTRMGTVLGITRCCC